MNKQSVKELNKGDKVSFCGILSDKVRSGKFIKIIDDYLIEVDYGDHTEHNHIANIFTPERLNYEN